MPKATLEHVERSSCGPNSGYAPQNYLAWVLTVLALLYAFLAGLHTLQDTDLPWQLASGRWIVQHHHIPSQDVFSYTAQGEAWIYPALSEICFYLVYLLGGYALLSWMGAVAGTATIALLIRRGSLSTVALALLAVPMIASRTQPRAEMFTTIWFAAFLSLLWQYHRTGRAPLWILPLLMIAWVNLHLGFLAGLAVCAGYVLLELLDLPFGGKRAAASGRLRRAWPWLALTAVGTLVNPWMASIYLALIRQQQAQHLHNLWLTEWDSIRPSWASLHQALDWRDPQSAFWWLLGAAVVAVILAMWRKHWGAAVWLATAAYLAMQHVRLQALFACVVVVLGGPLVAEVAVVADEMVERRSSASQSSYKSRRLRVAGASLLAMVLISLACVRCWDLISGRYYLRSAQRCAFGAGLSTWLPERAVDFLQREKLPANVFNGYSLGGYLTWRLFPEYRDYIDGRALPFGSGLFFRAYDLAAEPPESAAWRQEAETRNINTIIVPLSRYQGMRLFPQLPAFCRSKLWRPVYLDEVSAIFVRATPQAASLINRLQIDCSTVSFNPPPGLTRSPRANAALFNFWANAGGVLYSLERYPEALAALDRAQSLFHDNANLHLLRALVLQQTGQAAEAEAEFRSSLSLEPTDEGWFDVGLFYMTQRRYPEAADIFRRSAASAARPDEQWMMLGQAYVQMRQPQPALEAFDKAVDSSPFGEGAQSLGATFNSLIAAGRANAWYQLGDLSQAVSFQEEAVRLAPQDRQLWLGLADLYEVQGRTTKAAEARLNAQAAASQ